jgi:hypothetical protein
MADPWESQAPSDYGLLAMTHPNDLASILPLLKTQDAKTAAVNAIIGDNTQNISEQNDPFYQKNSKFVTPESKGQFYTSLSDDEEKQFRSWVKDNNAPFRPELDNTAEGNREYDMRGFWKGLKSGDPHAHTGIDPTDGKLHFSDYWKTPYHESFSNESKFASKNAPHWENGKLVESTEETSPQTLSGGTRAGRAYEKYRANNDTVINSVQADAGQMYKKMGPQVTADQPSMTEKV